MADYKVIFRSDETTVGEHRILWEPGCPVLFSAIQVSRNTQTSEAYLQIKIRNVSDSTIKSVGCTAKIGYVDDTVEDYTFEDLDVDLREAAEKPLKPQMLPRGDVEYIDVILTSVVTSHEKWKSTGKAGDIPKVTPLALSDKGMAERQRKLKAAGVDARAYSNAVQDQGSWWVCACGQVNVGRGTCCECNSKRELLRANEDDSKLISSADDWSESIYQKAVELAADEGNAAALSQAADLFKQIPGWKDSDQLLANCNAKIADIKAKSSRKTKKTTAIIGAIVVVAAAIALFVVNVVIPDGKYNDAIGLANNGQYDEAVAAFQELGDYKDSKAQIVATYAKQCAAQLDAGDNDAAMATIEKMKSAGADAQTIGEIAQDAASKAMDEGNYVIATVWYDLLGDKEGVKEAEYSYASSHLDRNDELTYKYLADLKEAGYKDSADLYSTLFDWRFEFAIATYDAYDGKNWVDMSSYDKREGFGFTMVDLLVRATSGPPNQEKTLHMEGWRIKAKSQIDYTGEWVHTKSSDWGNWTDKVTVTSDGKICTGYMGADLYSEAFKVKVTDPDTGEVLYEGEIHRNE